MSLIPGKYQHYKNENIDEYFSTVGVPYVFRKMISLSSPLMEISLNGDIMTIKTSALVAKVEDKFKIGEEYDEKMPDATARSITKIVNDHEMVTESVIPETKEKSGRHYLFTEDELIVTLTHENAKTPGKRFYRRQK